MDHILTVGEIYDKAIDLCLRNAPSIALLALFFLLHSTLSVLNTTYGGFGIFPAMHVHPREAILGQRSVTVLAYALRFGVLPVLEAALLIVFDRMLRGRPVTLTKCFRSPIQRTANVVGASLICSVIGLFSYITLIVGYAELYLNHLPAIVDIIVALLTVVLILLSSLLMLGSAVGLARVALDAGRVLPSIRDGIVAVFSKMDRRRSAAVALPLLIIVVIGSVGFFFAGVEAFVLSGLDAANILIRSIGDTIAWSIWLAVATVYYRNLVPAERP